MSERRPGFSPSAAIMFLGFGLIVNAVGDCEHRHGPVHAAPAAPARPACECVCVRPPPIVKPFSEVTP